VRPPHGHAGAAAFDLCRVAGEAVNVSRARPRADVLTRRCVSTHAAAYSFEPRAAAVPGGGEGLSHRCPVVASAHHASSCSGLKKSPHGGIWLLPRVTELTKRSRWSGGNFRKLNAAPGSCMRAP